MKAILVIDMPKDCRECPCFYDWLYCQAKDGLDVLGDEIPSGCPLKSMPKCMYCEHYSIFGLCMYKDRLIPKEHEDNCDILEDLLGEK